MIYRQTISTPANRPEGNPLRTVFEVTKGLVHHIEIYFPSGSEGLLHTQIIDGGFQVWPSTPGGSFIGDDIYFPYDELYIKEIEPFEFNIITWNDDDLYKHEVIVGISLVSKEIFKARFLPSMMYKEFEAVYKRILDEQQRKKLKILKAPFFPITGGT